MKRVWSGSSLPDTAHFKNLLEHAGIACVIKNRELGGGIGDLPVFDCAPEIWVLDDARRAGRGGDSRQRAAGRARRRGAALAAAKTTSRSSPRAGAAAARTAARGEPA